MARIGMLVAALAMVLAACGSEQAGSTGSVGDGDGDVAGGAAGMCLEGAEDCVDTPQLTDDEPPALDDTGVAQFRRDAEAILGWPEEDVSEFIRIGRRGDEQMALTEDYRVGRITAELDDPEGDGTYLVTKTTVELPDGPETFELDS
jgi:hypothetical protein